MYPGRPLPPVVTLSFYGDESDKGQVFAVGGYLATTDFWDSWFTPRWQHIITNGVPRPISEFHASDCQHFEGDFKGWSPAETRDLTRRLVDLIIEACRSGQCFGFGAALIYPGFVNPDDKSKDARRARNRAARYGYGWTAGLTLEDALNVAAGHAAELSMQDIGVVNRQHAVRPVLDKKKKFAHIVSQGMGTLRKKVLKELSDYVKDPVPEDSKEVLPLQAADLLAYEIRKEVEHRCLPQHTPRRSLERLVDEGKHRARCAHFGPLDLFNEHLSIHKRFPVPDAEWLFESGKPLRHKGLWGVL